MLKHYIVRVGQNGTVQHAHEVTGGAGKAGKTLIFKASPGSQYELVDVDAKIGPYNVLVKRSGKDLLIAFEDGTVKHPDVIIQDYYALDSGAVIGQAGNGLYYEYVPESGDFNEYLVELQPELTSSQALAGNQVTPFPDASFEVLGAGLVTWSLISSAVIGGIIASYGSSSSNTEETSASPTTSATPASAVETGTANDDTFLATLDNSTFEGGGGLDIADFKLAESTAITVDLSNTSAQDTGFGTHTFSSIEGIAGGSGDDIFTDNASDNVFEGRGGDDTFYLSNSGHDTLVYNNLADTDNGGGNGVDMVNDFSLGTYETTANADRLDISSLLKGYTADADGAAHYINDVATIDSGDNIGDYVQVTQSGADTLIAVDRDGAGSSYDTTTIATLQDVNTDLATLLANHQLVVI